MGSFSVLHWAIVALVVVILFGPKRLPLVAKGLGESIRDFKKAMAENEAENARLEAAKTASTTEAKQDVIDHQA